MPRPNKLDEQSRELLPILAQAFGELGYRRATTAELARRCSVRENILYRHWADKLAMFVAALDYVHDLAARTWRRLLEDAPSPEGAAAHLLAYEAQHLGEFGNYRIIFSALGDTDHPEIRRALRRMYRGFFRLIHGALSTARGGRERKPPADLAAWAVIGVGTIATVAREVGLLSGAERRELIEAAGQLLITGCR